MVDWQSPATIHNVLDAYIKVLHVVHGVYIWEFISNIGFEYGLISGRRLWRWTAAIYIACRVCTISQVVIDLVGLNLTYHINCKIWMSFSLFFRYITISIALSLYALRTIAIFQRSKIIIFVTGAVIFVDVILWVRRIAEARVVWDPEMQTCLRLHTHSALAHNAMMLGSEVFFLLLMAGSIYFHNPGFRATKTMFREGLLWLTFAVLMQTIVVTCLILNLNDPTNVLFIPPAVVFTSIGATRMYRTLSDRQAGNLLDFWETSQDGATGEIRFRRQTQLVGRSSGRSGDSASITTALPMVRRDRPPQQSEERFVERFEARDIVVLDHESESMRDGIHSSIATGDDKSEVEWVHAK